MDTSFRNESLGGFPGFGGWGGGYGNYGGCGWEWILLLLFGFGRDGFGRGGFDREGFARDHAGCSWSDFELLMKDAINNKTGAVEKVADACHLDLEFVKQCCCDTKAKLGHIDEKIGYEAEKVGWHLSDKINGVDRHLDDRICDATEKLSGKIHHTEDRLGAQIHHVEDRLENRFEWLKDSFCNFRNENQRDHFATRLEIERSEGRLSRQAEHDKDEILKKLNFIELDRKNEEIARLREKVERCERNRQNDFFNFKLDGIISSQKGIGNSLNTIIGTGNTVVGPTNTGTQVDD